MATDQLQRFLFDGTAVRGEIAQLNTTYQEVLANNTYPEPIQRLLGELLAACALLTATVKLDGTLSMEVRGSGALSLLMAESNRGQVKKWWIESLFACLLCRTASASSFPASSANS